MKFKFNITEKLIEASPRSVPSYSCKLASQYLDIPEKTLRSWFFGTTYKHGVFDPIFAPADPDARLLSFENLAEAFVYRALRIEKVNSTKIKRAMRLVKNEYGSQHPLVEHEFVTNGLDLFMRAATGIKCVSSDQEYFGFYTRWLSRADWNKSKKLSRIYPNTRPDVFDAPRVILFDPDIAFGRTVTSSRFIPTKAIADRFIAGETLEELKSDYRCDALEIDEAIRIEWKAIKESKAA